MAVISEAGFKPSNVPIIGEPQIEDWFVVLQVKCPCGAQFQLVGQPGSMRACKGKDGRGGECHRIYRIDTLPVIQPDGQIGAAPICIGPNGAFAAGLGYGIAQV